MTTHTHCMACGQRCRCYERAEAMGTDWMTGDQLSQAIPPDYTYLLGSEFLRQRAAVQS